MLLKLTFLHGLEKKSLSVAGLLGDIHLLQNQIRIIIIPGAGAQHIGLIVMYNVTINTIVKGHKRINLAMVAIHYQKLHVILQTQL